MVFRVLGVEACEKAPHPDPLPARGAREGHAQQDGEGRQALVGVLGCALLPFGEDLLQDRDTKAVAEIAKAFAFGAR